MSSSHVDRTSELARTEGRDVQSIAREVTSWEGVTARTGEFGTIELRLGRYVIGLLPRGGLVDDERSGGEASGRDRTIIQRMRDGYERAQEALDRGAGVTA